MFPQIWKVAKVIPLHKKDEIFYPKNYCPVRLLPVLSKIHPSHHGFRQKHNTSTALIQMMDTWVGAFDNDEVSAVFMLDMSAAFDLVDYDVLSKKLNTYGFEKHFIQWTTGYLSQRSQQDYIDGVVSDSLDIEVGVPQGSILGLSLYMMYNTSYTPMTFLKPCMST